MNELTIFLGIPGGYQIVIVLVVILLLFGGKKIPELMKGLGSGIKEFKDASKADEDSTDKVEEKK
ncbi:twin-arginine translocase TatA/TatE family subunit [Tenacibaculum tangerinum]|uniref:Sec-independent protein translocase protein TatA n=1 Tax=Tenacibaculum tangerinum TaxID=3038772 RepID=A0ABY8KZI4_9FLAO|nr:twin-arginine translocase TatA/TatE family subunit [Tenacibaculum tangerinum]WGH74619.1 twin-arginine translocase TatA/TatE family subunit [Tenacibaculum tangerinum]